MPEATAEAADAAFHFGDARLEHGRRRVHDAGIDVARDLEVEQIGAVLGVVEGVGRGLVDRHGGGLGGGLRGVAVVQGDRFELHGAPPLSGSRKIRITGFPQKRADAGAACKGSVPA